MHVAQNFLNLKLRPMRTSSAEALQSYFTLITTLPLARPCSM